MRTLINFLNPITKKRQLGALNPLTHVVKTADDSLYDLKALKKTNQDGGIGYFETREEGKIIQRSGPYKKKG